MLFILLEVASYYVIVVKGANFYLPLELNDRENIPAVGPASTDYYYELGWEPAYPNEHGYRGGARDVSNAVVAVFGDSYTKAHPEIEKSWPYLLEQKLGRPVLNYGVSGYGTGQAYLRFEKRYMNNHDTPYVALFIMSENIARTVNVYRGFYRRLTKVRPTKPRFILDKEGAIQLLQNPIMSAGEVKRLWDIDFLRKIGANDYWYQYYEQYNLNELVGFPYSYYLMKAAPYYFVRWYQRRIQNRKIYEDLYAKKETAELLRKISSLFISRAMELGSTPIIVFLPNWKDLVDYEKRRTTIYDEYFNDFRRNQYTLTFDAMDYFSVALDGGKSVSDFFISRNDGHYNEAGERVIADGLYEILMDLDADRNEPLAD